MGQVTNQRDERVAAARARRGSARRQSADSEFINLELDKVATDDFRVWREDHDHVIDAWTSLLEEGYRVNTKYDSYSSSCAAFIIPDGELPNSGYILTGRGGNAYRAVAEAIYKHEVLLSGSWADAMSVRRGHDDPDF